MPCKLGQWIILICAKILQMLHCAVHLWEVCMVSVALFFPLSPVIGLNIQFGPFKDLQPADFFSDQEFFFYNLLLEGIFFFSFFFSRESSISQSLASHHRSCYTQIQIRICL